MQRPKKISYSEILSQHARASKRKTQVFRGVPRLAGSRAFSPSAWVPRCRLTICGNHKYEPFSLHRPASFALPKSRVVYLSENRQTGPMRQREGRGVATRLFARAFSCDVFVPSLSCQRHSPMSARGGVTRAQRAARNPGSEPVYTYEPQRGGPNKIGQVMG